MTTNEAKEQRSRVADDGNTNNRRHSAVMQLRRRQHETAILSTGPADPTTDDALRAVTMRLVVAKSGLTGSLERRRVAHRPANVRRQKTNALGHSEGTTDAVYCALKLCVNSTQGRKPGTEIRGALFPLPFYFSFFLSSIFLPSPSLIFSYSSFPLPSLTTLFFFFLLHVAK